MIEMKEILNEIGFNEVKYLIQLNEELIISYIIKNEKKEYEKAILFFQKSIDLKHNNVEYLHECGRCYDYLDNYPKAEEYYLQVLQINPNFSKTLSNYGVLYENYYNDYKKAEEYYLK